ncbi:Crp/Fnr family transcriptional regulator [Soonwooa sp.]|uniref:Crp/Fnr family transcriptional regulator n=1 Tax=Soonwooa sp. TaxID=1938592 RepID=UPI00262F7787|nr:Crp/Fnr family transcriptional regulator [Soonwooa sp.]
MTLSYHNLIAHISSYISLSEIDIETIKSSFEIIEVKKNTLLEEENKLTKYLYFIDKGFVRVFYVKDGEERSTQINCPSRFISSYQSFIMQTKAYDNVQSITDCVLYRITKEQLDELSEKVEKWNYFGEKIYEQALVFNEERTRDMILLTAEERYLKLIKTQPEIIKNVPLQYIASYIGIKPESLSRIRKQLNF